MKKTNKKAIVALCGGLLIGGAYLTYQRAVVSQPVMSDLTLANIEALAFAGDPDRDVHGGVSCERRWKYLVSVNQFFRILQCDNYRIPV